MNKTKINATVVAHSINPQRDELISILATFPRMILAEVNTHRQLSKNTSSSRAIPFKKMVESIQNDPFIPIAWQKNHKGMQGTEYFINEKEIQAKVKCWLEAKDSAIRNAKYLNSNLVVHEFFGEDFISYNQFDEDDLQLLKAKKRLENTGVTKQLCNRLLEPFMWTTMLITGSKEGWDNFFKLRCPQYEVTNDSGVTTFYNSKKECLDCSSTEDYNKFSNFSELEWLNINKGQAEIHMMALAEKIYDAMNESTPKKLEAGEWHIPFEDKIPFVGNLIKNIDVNNTYWRDYDTQNKVKVSTAMAARTSYTVVGDEKEIDYQKMIELHDKLIELNHRSPLEHCARAMNGEEYDSFIKGQIELGLDTSCGGWGGPPNITYHPHKENRGWCRNFKGFIQYRAIIEEEK